MRLLPQARWRTLAFSAVLMMSLSIFAKGEQSRLFDLEAGQAAKTLKHFAKQADVAIVFDSRSAKDVRTESVAGFMTPREALSRMLVKTYLVFDQDDETGAFAVNRAKVFQGDSLETSGDEANENLQQTKIMNDNSPKGKARGLLKGLLSLSVATTSLTAEEGTTYELDEFVVSGFRNSITKAQEIKRSSDSMLDAISAEDIGKFPDQNLAESLQRISGVAISRERGEGQSISVRGLPSDFTRVQFNGRTLPSSNGSRSFDFTILPSTFISALEVSKTPTADTEEGGISATVNVKTLRPLDFGRRAISLSLANVHEENAGENDIKASLLYNDVFKDGTFGLTLGAHYDKRTVESHVFQGFGVESGTENSRGPTSEIDYNVDGDFDDVIRFAHATNYSALPETRERKTLLATGQWKPVGGVDFWAEFLMSEFEVDGEFPLNSFRWTNIRGEVTDSNIVANPLEGDAAAGFADFLEVDGVDNRNNSRQDVFTDELTTFALGGKREFDDWIVEAELSYSESEKVSSSLSHEVIGRAFASYDVTSDVSDIPTLIYADGFDPLDGTNFRGIGVNGNLDQQTLDENTDFRVDVDRILDVNLGESLILTSFEFGAKYSTREQFQGRRFLSVSPEAVASLVGEGYDPDIEGGSYDASRFMQVVSPSDFLDGYGGSSVFPSNYLSSSFGLLLEETSLASLIAAGTIAEGGPQEYTVEEDVSAAYVKLNFSDSENKLSGNIGLRYVSTDQTSIGFIPDFDTLSFNQGGAVTNVESSIDSISRSYSEILPSLNLKYSLSNEWQLRFGLARTLSRPDLSVLSPATSVNINVRSISSSNPNVDPYLADQVDLALEWYHGDAGLLSISPFYKKLDSFIVSASQEEQITYFDESESVQKTDTFSRFLPDNGEGADLYGFEISWARTLDEILKGLGVQANYTYVSADDVQGVEDGPFLPITGLSENSYNLITYYENKRFGVRLAYNFRDDFIVNNTSFFGDGEFTNSYSQFDLSANYNVNEKVSLFLEALNITDETLERVNSFGLLRNLEDNGRRVVFGVRAKL
ncbi:TonB-dependent receptor [Puniceicoccaceae bacterium K14]|nr:TonB-dependent receptor [Puniceicoccaceae bacterium K14]